MLIRVLPCLHNTLLGLRGYLSYQKPTKDPINGPDPETGALIAELMLPNRYRCSGVWSRAQKCARQDLAQKFPRSEPRALRRSYTTTPVGDHHSRPQCECGLTIPSGARQALVERRDVLRTTGTSCHTCATGNLLYCQCCLFCHSKVNQRSVITVISSVQSI